MGHHRAAGDAFGMSTERPGPRTDGQTPHPTIHPPSPSPPSAAGVEHSLPAAVSPLVRSAVHWRPAGDPGGPIVDVVVPVYNEQRDLEPSVRALHAYLSDVADLAFRITIGDNASTDGTLAQAERLAAELPDVRVVHLDEKGRGRALRRIWLASPAAIVAYMDVDLSTDLSAFEPLIAPLMSGHSDLSIGTRLGHGARVRRSLRRELISRCYNLLLKLGLGARFSDAQCGFKAMRADVARVLLPYVSDDAWFFDTELLVLAERIGLRVHEVPVDWTEDPNSTVDILRTSLDDLHGMRRMRRTMRDGTLPVDELRARLAGPTQRRVLGDGTVVPADREVTGGPRYDRTSPVESVEGADGHFQPAASAGTTPRKATR